MIEDVKYNILFCVSHKLYRQMLVLSFAVFEVFTNMHFKTPKNEKEKQKKRKKKKRKKD